MATERKKMKRRAVLKDELEKPTKEEYAVARCLKFSAPCKQGKFQGNSVDYFMGSKIVDFLLESKWSSKKNAKNPLFTTRTSCVIYCARLLEKGFFHRVEKPEKKDKSKKNNDKATLKEATPVAQVRKRGKKEAEDVDQTPKNDNNEEKKKKRKPTKLRPHDIQQFIDGPDLYVWIYDPVPLKTFIIGLLLVVGVIGVCLFPLWPPEIKVGIYYLSCAAIGFIGFIFALCIVRLVVFVALWIGTVGKVSLWLLPNLTEDVGFIDSFRPLYKLQYRTDPTAAAVAAGGGGGKGEDGKEEEGAVNGGRGDVGESGVGVDAQTAKGGANKEEEEDEDKNTNSSNGYEIVNPEDYELDCEGKEKEGDEEEEDDDNEEEEDDDNEEEDEEDDDDDGVIDPLIKKSK